MLPFWDGVGYNASWGEQDDAIERGESMESSSRRQKFFIEHNGIKYDCERIIHGKQVFRQTIHVCGVGSQEDEVEYAAKYHNVATMASTAHVIAGEIIENALEKIERSMEGKASSAS